MNVGRTTIPLLALCCGALAGCTKLGPMPATTGVSAVRADRIEGELQLGIMPGYHLSSSVVDSPEGSGVSQVSAVFDPAEVFGVPGLVIGVRQVGPDDDLQYEPMVGYRGTVGTGQRVSLAGVAFGTRAEAKERGASYDASRIGGELALDWRLGGENRWAEPHLLASVSVTQLSADGEYCLDQEGEFGIDCPDPPERLEQASVSGVYPAVTTGLAVHVGPHYEGPFHGGRFLLLITAGGMPRVIAGQEEGMHGYLAIGLAISAAFGASR